jgi:hypothetical protein
MLTCQFSPMFIVFRPVGAYNKLDLPCILRGRPHCVGTTLQDAREEAQAVSGCQERGISGAVKVMCRHQLAEFEVFLQWGCQEGVYVI